MVLPFLHPASFTSLLEVRQQFDCSLWMPSFTNGEPEKRAGTLAEASPRLPPPPAHVVFHLSKSGKVKITLSISNEASQIQMVSRNELF